MSVARGKGQQVGRLCSRVRARGYLEVAKLHRIKSIKLGSNIGRYH